jgi:hypothetical protein
VEFRVVPLPSEPNKRLREARMEVVCFVLFFFFASRDQRQLADSLAKGKIALTIGPHLLYILAVHQGWFASQTAA